MGADDLFHVAEIYDTLDALSTDEKSYRGRAREILHDLAQEYPHDSKYPAWDAYLVFQEDPIEGLYLAQETVRRFPDQATAHGILAALLLPGRWAELRLFHRRRTFELEAAEGSYPMSSLAMWANMTRESIIEVRGGTGAEFVATAKEQMGWDRWSSELLGQATSRAEHGMFGPTQATDLMAEFCNRNVVELDDGKLCEAGIRFTHTNLARKYWRNGGVANQAEYLLGYARGSKYPGLARSVVMLEEMVATAAARNH